MEEIKLLHTSDLHIDWLFDNFSSSAKSIRRKELIRSLDIICDIAIQQQVKALLIAGDLFHDPQVDRSSLAAVITNFQRLADADIFVLILPGNHDSLVINSIYNYADFPTNVHVFTEKEWSIFDKIPSLKVYGFPYFEELKHRKVLSEIQVSKNNYYNVALLHGSYKQMEKTEDYMPFTDADIEQSNFDYIALGHYHNFLDCTKGKVKCFYPGSPNSLSFNNINQRQVILTKLTLAGTEVKPVPIPGRKYMQVEYDMTFGNPIDLFMKIEEMKDPATCLKLNIIGMVCENNLVDVNDIKNLLRDKYFHLEVSDKTSILPDNISLNNSIKAIYFKKMKALLEKPDLDKEEKLVIEQALKIGYLALERGQIG